MTDTARHRIRDGLADPERKRSYVRDLFGAIAKRYDLTNDVMSLGLHRVWKRRLVDLAELDAQHVILDLAAGTGDLALAALRQAPPGVTVYAADLTPAMLQVGKSRPEFEAAGAEQADTAERSFAPAGWIGADAEVLPFPDASFDRVLIGYGLRNFADLDAGLREILRCLKPGGRMIALDFGHPRAAAVKRAYLAYLDASTRAVGWALHRNVEAYAYIPESLRVYPGQDGVAERMRAVGFESCGVADLMFGTMAINFGTRPRGE